ncbi:DsbA-like protein [Desulfosarcina variabilis str. Montpellier]|uniref:DsbA family oxidoreductase n=1 Tax=Desulfosarcina variabilis TaxID=2300 RepID=UPI003AFB39C2
MSTPGTMEIFSDFNCAWCYFDHDTVNRLTAAYDIEIVWRAFPLHRDIPRQGLSIEELFDNNQALMTKKLQLLEQKAASLGLAFANRTTISDTRQAQELFKWADTQGKGEAFHDAIFKAYFAEGLNVAQQSVLLDVTEIAGLSREKARSVLEQRSFSQAVDDDWKMSEEREIIIAPTYIINQKRLAGSQPYHRLASLVERNLR